MENLTGQGEFPQALDWSTRMSDENSRQNSARNAFSQWQSRDPDAAKRWFEQTELTENLRKALEPYVRGR